MWIRSQDKLSICNLDNIDCITRFHSINPKYKKFEISAFNGNEKTILGYYQTEERAIEVLDEICNAYISLNEYHNGNLSSIGYPKNGVYHMPEA